MAVHETNISTLTVGIAEMRDHLVQAGVRIHRSVENVGVILHRMRGGEWGQERERGLCVKTTPQKTRFRDVKYARIWDTD